MVFEAKVYWRHTHEKPVLKLYAGTYVEVVAPCSGCQIRILQVLRREIMVQAHVGPAAASCKAVHLLHWRLSGAALQ